MTVVIAESMASMAERAPEEVLRSSEPTPSTVARRSPRLMAMRLLALLSMPICAETVVLEPSVSWMPLNSVTLEIREISELSWENSSLM